MVDIIYGIDGTGAFDQDEYAQAMRNSFVQHLCKFWPTTESTYVRGPTMEGISTGPKAVAATQHIAARAKVYRDQGMPVRVFLTGYSRGGAAVIRVARNLAARGIDVDGLILFDAVDRSFVIGTDKIPGNVKIAIHARRDPLAMSRQAFGNTGTTHDLGVDYREAFFFGTHGAVGGARWRKAGNTGYIHEVEGITGGFVQVVGRAVGNLIAAATFVAGQGRIDPRTANAVGMAVGTYGAFRVVATKSTVDDEKSCEKDTLAWVFGELAKQPLSINLPARDLD